MIEIEEWRFGGNWIKFSDEDFDIYEMGTEVLEQLYAQMLGWA